MSFLNQLKNLFSSAGQPAPQPLTYPADAWTIPTLVISYFPVKNGTINRAVTGDVSGSLEQIRQHTVNTTGRVVQSLETGSIYHGYKDSATRPSLRYQIVDTLEFLEPLPTWPKSGHNVPMTDYNAIMQRVDIKHWVEQRGIKEVWLWGYHGGVIDLWESNMAGPFGDISNSDRDPHDLPVLGKTYTVCIISVVSAVPWTRIFYNSTK